MSIKKKHLKSKYSKGLSDLNDQLCYFLFSTEEINRKLADFNLEAIDLYTKDLFSQNSESPRINVKVKDLPLFKKTNEKLTFGSYFSTSYELFAYYLDDLLSYLKEIDESFIICKNNRIEVEFIESINDYINSNSIREEILLTIKYLRLRRNHFIHLNEGLSGELSKLITDSGENLNAYWKESISTLDFADIDILNYSKQNTIDLLKLLKILLDIIDDFISSNLNEELVLNNFISKQPKMPNVLEKDNYIRKIRTHFNQQFNGDKTISEITNFIFN